MWYILVHLLSWSTPAVASGESCAELAAAYANCANAHGATAPVEGEGATRVRELVARYHAASPTSAVCRQVGAAVTEACGSSSAELREARRRLARNVRQLERWRRSMVTQAREVGADVNLAVTCVPTMVSGLDATDERCYVLDRARPHTVVLDRANSGELPLTVGISGRCTFTVDPSHRLITADHCGETLQYGGWVLQTLGDVRVSAEPFARLEYSSVNIKSGRPFEDLSVWHSPAAPRGRPFYVLTRDESRSAGCEVEDGYYLACAPGEFASLNGRRASTLGFPVVRYHRRDRAETVVRSDGDLIYDAAGSRLLIHAVVSPGASGGPTYLPAGQRLGGVRLDRPLFLGPLSGFAPEDAITSVDDAFTSLNKTDVLAIVAIYDLAHVREVLSPP